MKENKKGGARKVEVIKQDVYREVCPDCGKEIISLNENQLDHNYQAHLLSCKKKNAK